MQNSKKCPPNLITFFKDMLNLVFQMGKSEMERKGNFAPSYLSFPVPFRPFQINPTFLSLSEKNGQLSGKGNIAFLSLTCMITMHIIKYSSLHTHRGIVKTAKQHRSEWRLKTATTTATLILTSITGCNTPSHVWRNLLLVFKAKKDKRKSALHSSWQYTVALLPPPNYRNFTIG